jgi:hypothetical protein
MKYPMAEGFLVVYAKEIYALEGKATFIVVDRPKDVLK